MISADHMQHVFLMTSSEDASLHNVGEDCCEEEECEKEDQ